MFLNNLYTLNAESEKFMVACNEGIKNAELMNPWYLPTIPTTLLSFNDICKAYDNLFQQMEKKGLHSLPKAV